MDTFSSLLHPSSMNTSYVVHIPSITLSNDITFESRVDCTSITDTNDHGETFPGVASLRLFDASFIAARCKDFIWITDGSLYSCSGTLEENARGSLSKVKEHTTTLASHQT
jgi:hypothetical protein